MEKNIVPKVCPICKVQTNYIYRICENEEKESADWYRCQCGVVFLGETKETIEYNNKYVEDYNTDNLKDNCQHAAYVYTPLLEELTYGRMMLDVGFASSYNMDFFRKRGWLVWGIDINSQLEAGGNIYKGDYENYDFSLNIDKENFEKMTGEKDIPKRTFDLIWMSHVLEHFEDPLNVLKKSYDMLSESGVMYISTPDIDFVNKTGLPNFPHWKRREHRVMWTEPALIREVERLGFKVIMSRRNYSKRFVSWYDIQLICQKRYF